MRKWLALFFSFLLAFSFPALAESDSAALDNSLGNQLGLEILQQLYLHDLQALVSPVSLTFALSMAAEGAQGETHEQLLSALGTDTLSLDTLRVAMDSLMFRGVKIANSAFISTKVDPRESYIGSLVGALDAELFLFEHMQDVLFEINEWARLKTDGMIESILEGKPDPSLLMVLINALAMDAKWQYPFDEDATDTGLFQTPSGKVEAQFMHATYTLPYLDTDLFQAVYLPYEAESLGMYVILPDENCMYDTFQALTENGMSLLDEMTGQRVALALPKVDMDRSMELSEILLALGVTVPFSSQADFSGILEDEALHIGGITQTVSLEVNEQGTRAAAATAVMMAMGAMPTQPPVEMVVDRPYIMLIYDEETSSILFAAAVSDPTM